MIQELKEPQTFNTAAMAVFCHHVYEYRKGLRNLILHTCRRVCAEQIIEKLRREKISYLIFPVGKEKMNVFFGDPSCIEVIRRIGKVDLSAYSDEEDFILGVMLGYCPIKQCRRYLQRKSSANRDTQSARRPQEVRAVS